MITASGILKQMFGRIIDVFIKSPAVIRKSLLAIAAAMWSAVKILSRQMKDLNMRRENGGR